MMAGNPNWWNMHPPNNSLIPSSQFVLGSSSSIPFNSSSEIPSELPHQSLSQLLFTGLPGEEERVAFSHFQSKNKLENWDEQILNHHHQSAIVDAIKQESGNLYGHGNEEFHVSGISGSSSSWSHMVPVSSSPRLTVTSFSSSNNNNNNLLDFTYNKAVAPDHTIPECNTTAIGGVCNKKSRSQPSSSQPPLKVRKEKLGDRITALHQLVSPFGKTDTASVLLEAIGYIRFLQSQIEALSSPYLGNAASNNMIRNQQSVVHCGERNSVFPEDPGQLLNDTGGLKRKGAPNQDGKEKAVKDLRSRGLCLVPVSCTQHVGSENGADYWAPAYGSGF